METNLCEATPASDIEQVREILRCMECGDEEAARELLSNLAHARDGEIYHELGKLTRELHDALTAFRSDSRLVQLADGEITDAKERLNYVIKMTEQAASCTLNLVEEAMPLCEQMHRRAGTLRAALHRFMQREMGVEDFRSFCRELDEFLPWIEESSTGINGRLSEVTMAQTFQDLTGQMIKKVITLVEEVEDNLVNMIRLSGQRQGQPLPAKPRAGELQGPQIPGRVTADAVSGQDEVDDLLSSLGF
jgi:chemotaxis protein CheZ